MAMRSFGRAYRRLSQPRGLLEQCRTASSCSWLASRRQLGYGRKLSHAGFMQEVPKLLGHQVPENVRNVRRLEHMRFAFCILRLWLTDWDARLCERSKVNRTIQCANCKVIAEERCTSDLAEYSATTQTEEVHCVVSPDFLYTHIVDDIPNDPYCTPGFITAFRMLSPLKEPVFAASARTLSGALAEMERLIGDSLFAGYVGYNGRAPGGTTRKEDAPDNADRNKSGGDARHTLVAYFEIVELASILCVDRETSNLAIRIFRHTASNTSLRNRNVESLATAAFVSATERRCFEYDEWLKGRTAAEAHVEVSKANKVPEDESLGNATASAVLLNPTPSAVGDLKGDTSDGAIRTNSNETGDSSSPLEWPMPPKRLTVREISAAANLDVSEVLRYLKVVNVALRKQRPENSASIPTHMPTFCRRLELEPKTRRLAIAIAEKAMQNNICSRRNPSSISAAAIYMACQLDGVRKTQAEICRATTLTEVTLRKVHKELHQEEAALLPDWFDAAQAQLFKAASRGRTSGAGSSASHTAVAPAALPDAREAAARDVATKLEPSADVAAVPAPLPQPEAPLARPVTTPAPSSTPLMPPPLPPGFGLTTPAPPASSAVPSVPSGDSAAVADMSTALSAAPAPAPANPSSPSPTGYTPPVSVSGATSVAANPANTANPLLAMMQNPAMQAFANAMAMMPSFVMPPPPPPPPLPPSASEADGDVVSGSVPSDSASIKTKQKGDASSSPATHGNSAAGSKPAPVPAPSLVVDAPTAPQILQTSQMPQMPQVPQMPAGTDMTGSMQMMMNMMKAMQAFQMMQNQASVSQAPASQVACNPAEAGQNPFALMAAAFTQIQGANGVPEAPQTSETPVAPAAPVPPLPVPPSLPSSTTQDGNGAKSVPSSEGLKSEVEKQ